jgi:hypothetical protein
VTPSDSCRAINFCSGSAVIHSKRRTAADPSAVALDSSVRSIFRFIKSSNGSCALCESNTGRNESGNNTGKLGTVQAERHVS